MLIMRRMAVNVLKQMVPPAYLHLVRELKTHNFFDVLKKMVVSNLTSIERAQRLRVLITGNAMETLAPSHPRLGSIHDIPGYIVWMEAKCDELESLDVADRCKLRPGVLLDQIAHHVGRFIESVRNGYQERRESHENPFTMATIKLIVAGMEKTHAIDVARSTESLFAEKLASQETRGAKRGTCFNEVGLNFGGSGVADTAVQTGAPTYQRSDPPAAYVGAQRQIMQANQAQIQGHGADAYDLVARQQAAAAMGPSQRDYDGIHHGTDFDYYGNTPPGEHRFAPVPVLHSGAGAGLARSTDRRSPYNGRWGEHRDRDRVGFERDRRNERGRSSDREYRRGRSNDRSSSRGDSRGRSRSRDREGDRRGSRSPRRSQSPHQREAQRQIDTKANETRPAHLFSETQLLTAGFGHGAQVLDGKVVHDCANCAWLDTKQLVQRSTASAYHSFAACLRPGGGMQNGVLEDAIDAQRRENDEILRNANGVGAQLHRMQYSADPRLTIEQGRATAKREPPLRVGMRAFPIQFMSMDMQWEHR